MTKTAIVAAFAALIAASPMALAQTQPQAAQSGTQQQAAGDTAIQGKLMPDQVLAGNLKGAEVYDTANQKIGTVKDIVISQTGRVVAVVLNSNDRNVAVGMQDLRIAKENNGSNGIQKVMLNVSQAQLNAAPPVNLNGTGSGSSSESSSGSGAAGGNAGAGGTSR